MLALREQAIRIVKLMCKFSQWRHPQYVQYLLEKDASHNEQQIQLMDFVLPNDFHEDANTSQLSNSFFYFESKAGQGNVLDFIRAGRVPVQSGNKYGREKLVFKEVKTHILDRMAPFFQDDKILFLPKSDRKCERDIKRLDGTKERYHT